MSGVSEFVVEFSFVLVVVWHGLRLGDILLSQSTARQLHSCFDQLTIALHSMTRLSNLDISWVGPMRAVFNIVAVVCFFQE